jgi:HPt (histidine-containing phosphotransfer) domain-containing protein
MSDALTEPLLDDAQLAVLRDALGDEDLHAMLWELPGAASEAIDRIRAAVEAGDDQEARRAAHVLKGVASSFGAARLAAVACELEHPTSSIASISQGVQVLDDLIVETSAALALVGGSPSGEAGT